MKLHPDKFDVQSISGYGPGWIRVDGEQITHSVVIASSGQRLAWCCARFQDLTADLGS